MSAHLPILQVVIPLLAAPLCVLLHRPLAAWLVYLLASLAALACSLLLLGEVLANGRVDYAIGGWAAPYGIEYVVDAANALVLLLVSLLGVATAVFAPRSVEDEIETPRIYLYYCCLCLYLAGLLGITITGDAFNVFVFLEISSLSAYALIALGRRRQALLAAFRYLVMGTIGGTFLLIGIGLMYALTGTLNMADLAARLPPLYGNRVLTAALGFITVGLAIKAAVFPLHGWQPGAYAESPSAASLLLAGAGAKVAIYAFLRYAFGMFGSGLVAERLPLAEMMLLAGVAAMLVGSAVACFQDDLKRILAWSSIGQIGYIVAAIGLATPQGFNAAFLHVFNHGLIKAGLFAVAGVLCLRLGSTRLDALAGLARRMPGTFAALLLGGLGLIGVPLTAGFVSKWALVLALVEQQQWITVAAVLLSSLLALIYVGRVIETAWFRAPPSEPVGAVPISMGFALWAIVGLTLLIGLSAQPLAAVAAQATAAMLGGLP
ncbi:MAG: proton-conducting transporter membrane subunit [Pseudomonadota bacterium]